MATIDYIDGLRVVIYSNDHRPAHVHVIGNEQEAVFHLHCPDGPPMLHENFGFPKHRLRRIVDELKLKLPKLCREWRRIHGPH